MVLTVSLGSSPSRCIVNNEHPLRCNPIFVAGAPVKPPFKCGGFPLPHCANNEDVLRSTLFFYIRR